MAKKFNIEAYNIQKCLKTFEGDIDVYEAYECIIPIDLHAQAKFFGLFIELYYSIIKLLGRIYNRK